MNQWCARYTCKTVMIVLCKISHTLKLWDIFDWTRHWRDAKKWNREEKEKYGIHISNFEKRKEKCWDLFSGSRREREFLQKNREICDHFSNVEKRRIFFLFDKKVKFTYHQSQSPFWVLTSKSRIKIVCWKIPSQKRNDHLSGSTMIIHYIVFPLCNLSKYSHRRLLLEVLLQNTAGQNQPK